MSCAATRFSRSLRWLGRPTKKSLSAFSPCPVMAAPRGFAARDRATTRRLVRAAQRGDRRAGDEIVRRYEPLVQHAVWKLKLPPWCEREDLAQEARLGLVTAIVHGGRSEVHSRL